MDLTRIFEKHPDWDATRRVLETLHGEGHKAFLAGGCVRDALLGRLAQDFDIATSATPEQVELLFPGAVTVGKAFGVVVVPAGRAQIEVASFRKDGLYIDGRRPTHVEFATPEEDAQRRDFTVNALFFDLTTSRVLDFVGGEADLGRGILRTVGDPAQRFKEDHLRLIRAIRFAAQLGFQIEPSTWKSVQTLCASIQTVSRERLRDEMGKLLTSSHPRVGIGLLQAGGYLPSLFPGFEDHLPRLEALFEKPCGPNFQLAWSLWLFPWSLERPWASSPKIQAMNEVSQLLHTWKFSTADARSIGHVLGAYRSLSAGTPSTGLIKRSLIEPWSALFINFLRALPSEYLHDAHRRALDWGPLQVSPFLAGKDVLDCGFLAGPKAGELLEKAFTLQLEGALKDRPQALEWLRAQPK